MLYEFPVTLGVLKVGDVFGRPKSKGVGGELKVEDDDEDDINSGVAGIEELSNCWTALKSGIAPSDI